MKNISIHHEATNTRSNCVLLSLRALRAFVVQAALLTALPAVAVEPLKVCATVPDLGNIASVIGGDAVTVTTFAKGTEDPHFIDAKPSFVKTLAAADVFIETGLEMEIGWSPVLLKNSRNANVQVGGRGYIDASSAITPLDKPAGPIDRSLGDVHPLGNPHYLLDPMNGLKVAALIRDRFSELRPEHKVDFASRYDEFRRQIAVGLVGEKLAAAYDIEKLMRVADAGRLEELLEKQKQTADLGGWLGAMRPFKGSAVYADHTMWVYFAQRFGITVAGYLEPKPGMTPTTAHLSELVSQGKEKNVKAVMTGAYFDPRHARFVADRLGIKTAVLAHQVSAAAAADSYIHLFDHDIKTLTTALAK
jgi:ABC-type Zn uptake system ZnuABC Zn-binding protein ZnuA